METTELAGALRAATADLEPRPGFTDAVVRGSRHRRTRNRVTVAVLSVAVVLLIGATAVALWPAQDDLNQVADDPRLNQPTRGELAGDRDFLSAAATVWRNGLPPEYGTMMRGAPHTYWAGNTPAGRAAVLMQPLYQTEGDLAPGDPDRRAVAVGLVALDPADGALRVVFQQPEPYYSPDTSRFGVLFGPDDRTVLVLDPGVTLWFSAAPASRPGGRLTRDWQPLPASDGVATAQIPEALPPSDARVLARRTRPAPEDLGGDGSMRLESAAQYLIIAKARFPAVRQGPPSTEAVLQWGQDEAARRMRVGGAAVPIPQETGQPMMTFLDGALAAGLADPGYYYLGFGGWSVIAGLPDGRTALVSELLEDAHPSIICALLLNPDGSVNGGIRGEPTYASVPLPVRLRLPDAQGWVVAAYGATLRYRTAPEAPWLDAGPNAALLPDAATEVEVSRGGIATEVGLPR